MAQKIDVHLVDDLDGTEATGTISFSLDGKPYEIDLSTDNANKMRDSLAPFIAAARRSSGRIPTPKMTSRPTTTRSPVRTDREQNQAIREWAQARGMKVSDRGRIPAEVLEAYHAKPEGVRASVTPSSMSPLPGDGLNTPAPAPQTVVEAPTFQSQGDTGGTVTQLPKAKGSKAKSSDLVEGEYTEAEVVAWCESRGKPIKRHGNGTVKGLHLFRQAMVRERGPKMIAQTG